MLEKYKQTYKQVADLIPGWDKMSKNELLNGYAQAEKANDDTLKDSYAAAVMCKYWGAINKYYLTSHGSFENEDFCDWLEWAVAYALKHKDWLEEGKAISKRHDSPNTCVNKCIASTRLQFYQASNYDLRKGDYTNLSYNQLEEDNRNLIPICNQPNSIEDSEFSIWCNQIVHQCFKTKYYMKAFMIDIICNGDSFIRKSGPKIKAEYPDNVNTKYKPKYHRGPSIEQFSKDKMVKELKHMDSEYCTVFSNEFNIDKGKVMYAINALSKLKTNAFRQMVDRSFNELKLDVANYVNKTQIKNK